MRLRRNRDVYGTAEFDLWLRRVELEPEERFLIRTYLDPAKRTLEAGAGAGRVLFELQTLGFGDLHGYDLVPNYVEECRRRDPLGAIRFDVGDATDLKYPTESFDQVLYLQQLLCLLDDDAARRQALSEARRVLRLRGVALFSFLSYETRLQSPMHAAFLSYVNALRKLRGHVRSPQSLPWLRLGGKLHWSGLVDHGPHVYWYQAVEGMRSPRAAPASGGGNRIVETDYRGALVAGLRQLIGSTVAGSPICCLHGRLEQSRVLYGLEVVADPYDVYSPGVRAQRAVR